MPILSWLRTGGKCRHCKEPIASRYLWVEVLVGSLFAIIWLQTMCGGLDPQIVPFALKSMAAAVLVAIVFIDWELYIIPDELNAALLFIGLGYGVYRHGVHDAVLGAFIGWALLWGFVFLGRIAFGKDAMGDGDIKMMRGVGAVLGPTLVLANVGLGVVLGLVGGIVTIAIEARRERAKADASPEGEAATPFSTQEDPAPEATPIPLVLLGGVLYLFCVDVVALFVPPLSRWIASRYPEELLDESDDWVPAATAIPFGPYLAAGALICMLAGGPIEREMRAYWNNATGRGAGTSVGRSGRTPARLRMGLQTPENWDKGPAGEV